MKQVARKRNVETTGTDYTDTAKRSKMKYVLKQLLSQSQSVEKAKQVQNINKLYTNTSQQTNNKPFSNHKPSLSKPGKIFSPRKEMSTNSFDVNIRNDKVGHERLKLIPKKPQPEKVIESTKGRLQHQPSSLWYPEMNEDSDDDETDNSFGFNSTGTINTYTGQFRLNETKQSRQYLMSDIMQTEQMDSTKGRHQNQPSSSWYPEMNEVSEDETDISFGSAAQPRSNWPEQSRQPLQNYHELSKFIEKGPPVFDKPRRRF